MRKTSPKQQKKMLNSPVAERRNHVKEAELWFSHFLKKLFNEFKTHRKNGEKNLKKSLRENF